MKLFAILLSLTALAACDHTSENARKRADRLFGKGAGHCVNENDDSDKISVHVAFCTDGKTLVICTGDDGCITVNVTAEAAQ